MNIVGRRNHVEVEVSADIKSCFGRQAFDEEGRAEKTRLLARPETEADSVVDVVLGKRLGNVQDSNSSGAIVVDTWAGLHGVGVATDNEDGVFVAADGLCDDVLTTEC